MNAKSAFSGVVRIFYIHNAESASSGGFRIFYNVPRFEVYLEFFILKLCVSHCSTLVFALFYALELILL